MENEKEWKMKRKRMQNCVGMLKKIGLLSGLPMGRHCKTWGCCWLPVVKCCLEFAEWYLSMSLGCVSLGMGSAEW